MSFFKNLSELGLKRVVVELIITGENPIVVLTPKSSATDSAIESMKPLILKYKNIAELDEKFFVDISQPIKSTSEFFDGVEAYQKTLDAAKLEADKKKKEADEKKKTAADKKAEKATPEKEVKPEVKKPEADLFTQEIVDEQIKEVEEVIAEAKEVLIVEETPVEEIQEVAPEPESIVEAEIIEETAVEKPVAKKLPSLFG